MAMVGQAVEQRCGHLCVTEDAGPFTEAQVGGNHDAGALLEPGKQVEQQRPARSTERQVAQFIEDHEVGIGQAVRNLP